MLTALTSGRFSLCRKCSGFPAALLYLFGAYSKRSTSLRAHTTSLPLTQRPYDFYEFALMCSLVLPIASAHICTSVTSSSFNTGHRSYSHDVRSLAVQSPIVPSTALRRECYLCIFAWLCTCALYGLAVWHHCGGVSFTLSDLVSCLHSPAWVWHMEGRHACYRRRLSCRWSWLDDEHAVSSWWPVL